MYSSSDINKIKNPDSRINFELVLQSYYSKNYKASILLLYNLVINDLYSKLILMNEKEYVNFQKELEEINNNLREKDESKYSIVEERIFTIYRQKKILNHSTIELLTYFKTIRNKCAHPIFFKENDYTPTEEEVYLFICKIYKDILIVEAFFKDPYKTMEKDIESFSFPTLYDIDTAIDLLDKDSEKVKKFFENKYYKYMTENNYIKLFKTLMDLSIRKNKEEILKNQYKHFLLLYVLLTHLNYNGKINILNKQFDWQNIDTGNIYDEINEKNPEGRCYSLSYLFVVLNLNHCFIEEIKDENEDLFNYLNEQLYSNVYLFIKNWKLFNNDIYEALKKLPTTLDSNAYRQIIISFSSVINIESTLDLLAKLLESTPDFNGYDDANENMSLFIKVISNLNVSIDQESLKKHFEIMNKNRQIYSTSRNGRNYQLKTLVFMGYDLSSYDNLKIDKEILEDETI